MEYPHKLQNVYMVRGKPATAERASQYQSQGRREDNEAEG